MEKLIEGTTLIKTSDNLVVNLDLTGYEAYLKKREVAAQRDTVSNDTQSQINILIAQVASLEARLSRLENNK